MDERLNAALDFCKKLVEARIKDRPIIDREKEESDLRMMEQTGEIFLIKNTIRKIKEHGKANKKPSRSRR